MTDKPAKSQAVLPVIGTILLLGLALLLWTGHHRSSTAAWVSAWQAQPAFRIPRRALAAASSATHVYVIGGMDNDNRYVAQVEYAPIRADGSLGAARP